MLMLWLHGSLKTTWLPTLKKCCLVIPLSDQNNDFCHANKINVFGVAMCDRSSIKPHVNDICNRVPS